MKALSPMRQKIMEYITGFTEENGYPPSIREICEAVGLRSPSTVHSHIKILQENGLLEKSDHKTRAITVKSVVSCKNIPVLGQVTAGQPILAQEEICGYVPYGGAASGNLFALKVRGDSMIGAAILDGDIVIVRQQQIAEHGQIVVALLEDEATVKRLYRQNGEIWLMPENEAYAPIDGAECSVMGVVVAVYRPEV